MYATFVEAEATYRRQQIAEDYRKARRPRRVRPRRHLHLTHLPEHERRAA